MAQDWKTRLVRPHTHAPGGFRSLVPPVCRASTTLFESARDLRNHWDTDRYGYTYGLYGTPTARELAARVCDLEGGRRSFLTPGGKSAIALVNLALLKAGDHVLLPQSVYGPHRSFATGLLGRMGIEAEFYPPTVGAAIEGFMRPSTKLVWCESPGSVTMEVQDVPAIAEVAHAHGARVAIDNTYSAGVYFDAFAHGVDVTLQALTKYVGGHSDLLLGSVTAQDEGLVEEIGAMVQHMGMNVSPDDCSLALRGLQTLAVRLEALQVSTLRVAQWAEGREEFAQVRHPALGSCPGHEVWKRDFTGSTSVFSVVLREGATLDQAYAFVDALRLFGVGLSWGGATSLAVVYDPLVQTPEAPLPGPIVRLNVGLERTEDIIEDLEQALDAVSLLSEDASEPSASNPSFRRACPC